MSRPFEGRGGALLLLALISVALGGSLSCGSSRTDTATKDAPEAIGSATPEPIEEDTTGPGASVVPTRDTVASAGLEIDFSVAPVVDEGGLTSAEVRFSLKDSSDGAPFVPESRPAVWIDLQKSPPGDDAELLACEDKVRLYAQGTVSFRPDIDLNSYFVLTLNDDPTISVIDPLLGVGGITQLYSMILLDEQGEDWALSEEENRLFITMPSAGQVAVADTGSFKVLRNVDAGSNPVRVTLQPDGRYVWVGNDSPDARVSGVTVIDPQSLKVAAEIATGAGHHDIAFSRDSQYAFVTNGGDDTLSVVDVERLKKVSDIDVGEAPVAVDFSDLSNSVYVASGVNGTITVFDGQDVELINTAPGLSALRFAPGGRWGFAVSGASNLVEVFDATTNSVVHSAEVAGAPDKVSFTYAYAYVHATRTAEVSLIDLAAVGRVEELPILQIIGGQRAPEESPMGSVADVISSVHEHGNHVLIANAADRYVYFYMEGMKAPMGGFQNYSRAPRAVSVIDRSIRETAPGEYVAHIRVPSSGTYQVAFLLDEPRIIHCFDFNAEESALASDQNAATTLDIEFITREREIEAEKNLTLRFTLVDGDGGERVSGLDDVEVLVTGASGSSTEHYHAQSVGGVYEAMFALPRPGMYNVRFAVPSLGVAINHLPALVLTATDSSTSAGAAHNVP